VADTKISALTAAGSVALANEFAINEAGVSKKVTGTQLAAFMSLNSGWRFLGNATANAAVRTGTVTWTGTFAELIFECYIAGYSANGIARLIVGPTAGLSETGTTFATAFLSMTPATTVAGTTSTSIPGWPLGVTAAQVIRHAWLHVHNLAADVKKMTGTCTYAGTAATTAPTILLLGGNFTDATNLINKAEIANYDALTGTTISTNTLNNGTFLNVWGRNQD